MSQYFGYDRESNRRGKVVSQYSEYTLPASLGPCAFGSDTDNTTLTASFLGEPEDGFMLAHAICWRSGYPPNSKADMNAEHYGGYLFLTPRGCRLCLRSDVGESKILRCDFSGGRSEVRMTVHTSKLLPIFSREEVFDFKMIQHKVVDEIVADLSNRWRARW
jgi:hypothetical protein